MNILITGTSRGIGYELVKLFIEQPGYNVIAVSRNIAPLSLLVKNLDDNPTGSTLVPIKFDLTDINNYDSFLHVLTEHVKHVDIMINNAGLLVNKPFETMDFTEVIRQYNVNAIGPYLLIQKCLLHLKKAKRAHVVNISSMGAVQGSLKFSGLSAYSSSKAALASITECLAEELKHTTVKFNCLALGAVSTEMQQDAFPGYQPQISALQMANYIMGFALTGHELFNGKIIEVSCTTP